MKSRDQRKPEPQVFKRSIFLRCRLVFPFHAFEVWYG